MGPPGSLAQIPGSTNTWFLFRLTLQLWEAELPIGRPPSLLNKEIDYVSVSVPHPVTNGEGAWHPPSAKRDRDSGIKSTPLFSGYAASFTSNRGEEVRRAQSLGLFQAHLCLYFQLTPFSPDRINFFFFIYLF